MKNKRKQWIINKNFQYSFLLTILIPLCLTVCVFWLGIELLFHEMISYAKELGLNKGHGFYQFLKDQKVKSFYIMLIISIPSFLIYLLWGVVYSNKIAGPLYRLNQYFINLKISDDSQKMPLTFRKGDYFNEISDSINSYLKKDK